MNTHEHAESPACQGVDCAVLEKAQDWFGDVECRSATETPAAQARRDDYGDFA